MAHIEREIVVNRPVEEVFDFLADGRNEPRYNPHMVRAEQVPAGPIGRGTQFWTEVRTNGRSMEMAYEITAYARPWRLAQRTIKAAIDVVSTQTFDPVPGGTHMRWVWELKARGAFKLLTPLVARIMAKRLGTVLANIKRFLEAQEMDLPQTLYAVPSTTSTGRSINPSQEKRNS